MVYGDKVLGFIRDIIETTFPLTFWGSKDNLNVICRGKTMMIVSII